MVIKYYHILIRVLWTFAGIPIISLVASAISAGVAYSEFLGYVVSARNVVRDHQCGGC